MICIMNMPEVNQRNLQQIKKWNNNLVGTKFTGIEIQFPLSYLISAYGINICDLYMTKLKITVKWNIIDQCNL